MASARAMTLELVPAGGTSDGGGGGALSAGDRLRRCDKAAINMRCASSSYGLQLTFDVGHDDGRDVASVADVELARRRRQHVRAPVCKHVGNDGDAGGV